MAAPALQRFSDKCIGPRLFFLPCHGVRPLLLPLLLQQTSLNGQDVLETNVLHQIPQVLVHLRLLLLDQRHLGHEVQSAFSLLLLQLEGDPTHGALLDTLHQVRDETGDLVAHALGGDLSHLVDDALVGVEVHGQAGVVLLDDDSGRLFHGLGTHTLLVGGGDRRRGEG